jgi:iron-sulfur cluster assembly protein
VETIVNETAPATNPESQAVGSRVKGFLLADSAVQRLRYLIEQQKTPEGGLRILVKGGGCSGLSYAMEWAQRSTEKDRVFERDGARVFIDSKSLLYLGGSELSFEQGLMSTGFKINNPNVKASCGCGESFSV